MKKVFLFTLIIVMLISITIVYAGDNDFFSNTSEINFRPNRDLVIISGGISEKYEEDYYKLITTKSGIFTFGSTGSTDTMGYLYDSNMSLLDSNNDSGLGSNFKITYYLTTGRTYYIKIRGYRNEIGLYFLEAKEPESNKTQVILKNFPLEKQKKPNWCWAACSVSVLKYFGINDVSQTDFVMKMKDHNKDIQGYPFEIKYGLHSYNIKYELFESNSPILFDEIVAEISKNNPIIVGLDLETTRHAVVIVGYTETLSKKEVIYMDPYTGTIKTEEYDSFSDKTLERLIKQ